MNNRDLEDQTAPGRVLVAVGVARGDGAQAAAPGITGPTFNLTAQPAYPISQPDGAAVYSWGYGCNARAGRLCAVPPIAGVELSNAMQVPGPDADRHRRRVGHGEPDQRPAGGGGQHVDPVSGISGVTRRTAAALPGSLAPGAASRHGSTVTYTFTASVARDALPTTAARKATCRSRWASTAPSSCCPTRPHRAHCASGLRCRAIVGGASSTGANGFPAGRGGLRPSRRPATTASICSSSPRWIRTFTAQALAQVTANGWLHGRSRLDAASRFHRAIPPGLFHDQRPLHAG